MWTLKPRPDIEKRLDRFKKKWQQELENVFLNLKKVKQAFDFGAHCEQVKQQFSCVHGRYPLGLISIDQRGRSKGAKPKPFRLYVFPEVSTKTLHLITLGDKDTQSEDVKLATAFVQGLLQGAASPLPDAKEGNENENENEKSEQQNVEPDIRYGGQAG